MEEIVKIIFSDPKTCNILGENILLECIEKNIRVFGMISDDIKTYEFCKKVISVRGNLLEFIPQDVITYEMCYDAVVNGKCRLQYVPEKFRTKELCLDAIKNDRWKISYDYIPHEFITEDFCLEMIKINKYYFDHIPENLKTETVCAIAVHNCGYYALEHIKNDAILTKMAKQFSDQLNYITHESKNKIMSLLIKENINNDSLIENLKNENEKLKKQVEILEETLKYYPEGEMAKQLAITFASHSKNIVAINNNKN